MGWDVSADVVDFDEAISWFRKKVPTPDTGPKKSEFDEDWEARQRELAQQAFKVAGVAQLDVVTDVYHAIDEALASGLSLDDFKSVVGDELEAAWGGSVANPGFRIETIFRTNVQSAYAAGRYAQMTDPEVLEDRPYWTYDDIDDDDECDICSACHGTTLPASDPWWASHHPLLHHNCRCEIHSLSPDEAKKLGIDHHGPKVEAAEGFGAPPVVDRWEPKVTDYPPELWKEHEAKKPPEEPAPPAPPPAGMVAGTHVRDLKVQRGLRNPPDVLGTIHDDPELLEVLAKHPLDQVEVRKTLRSKKANGYFTSPPPRVFVRTDRPPSTYGEAFEAGKSWSVSYSGESAEAAAKRTFVHELGHHIQYGVGGPPVTSMIDDAYRRGKPITKYAGSQACEYFAESFAAYKFHPAELRKHDPVGFELVERVLRYVKDNRR